MGIKNLFRKQLSAVIEWKNQDPNKIFYRYNSASDEIKNASKLIVAPGQGCIVVYEGKVENILISEGTYMLETDNHPFVTTLLKLRQNFESEHKMRFYFFRTAEIVNQKWGTATPVKYKDSIYNFPIELGAYGNYSVKLVDAEKVFTNIVGSQDSFSTDDLRQIIISRTTTELASYLAKAKYSYQEIDAHLSEISIGLKEVLSSVFENIGFEVTDFRLEATSFNDETLDRINKIANITSETLAAKEADLSYLELEKLRALRDVAKNEGGLAGAGLQIGAGLELSKSLVSNSDNLATPSSATNNMDDAVNQLKQLKSLLDDNILTREEFELKKKEILDRI